MFVYIYVCVFVGVWILLFIYLFFFLHCRNLTVISPANGVTIGSETSGGVFTVTVTDCHFESHGMRVKVILFCISLVIFLFYFTFT